MAASYALLHVKELVREGKHLITRTALQSAMLMGFLDEDITECICDFLEPSHFYKTMPSEQKAGMMQDVYKITYEGKRVYLKLQINQSGLAVIVSFKEDESFG
jgi:hypothetical protein